MGNKRHTVRFPILPKYSVSHLTATYFMIVDKLGLRIFNGKSSAHQYSIQRCRGFYFGSLFPFSTFSHVELKSRVLLWD